MDARGFRGTATSVRLESAGMLSVSQFKSIANANTTMMSDVHYMDDTRPITLAELQFFPLPQVLLKTGRAELTTAMTTDEEAILAACRQRRPLRSACSASPSSNAIAWRPAPTIATVVRVVG
jgi:hypothetical protein